MQYETNFGSLHFSGPCLLFLHAKNGSHGAGCLGPVCITNTVAVKQVFAGPQRPTINPGKNPEDPILLPPAGVKRFFLLEKKD